MIKKPIYLTFGVLVIIAVVVAATAGHNKQAKNAQSATQTIVQQPLLIDNSSSPSLQTQGSGVNPQDSSTSPQSSVISSMPGSTWLDDGYGSGTSTPPTSPCNTCKPGYGRVCPMIACPISAP